LSARLGERSRPLAVGVAAAGTAVLVGALVSRGLRIPLLGDVPAVALLLVVLFACAFPLLLGRWRLLTGIFFGWLIVEDLVRKLAGNDLRVYFVKDAIFVLLVASLFLDRETRGIWRKAVGEARPWLYALAAWAVIASVRSGFEDWRVPVLGLRLYFLYAPFVIVGYLFAVHPDGSRRLLLGLSALGAAASSLGIVQSIVGAGFLAPTVATPGLNLLNNVRGTLASGPVVRPTGPFVSSGRFATMAVLTVGVSLAAVLVTNGRSRWFAGACAALGAGGVWVSGGRGPAVAAAALAVSALVAPVFSRGGSRARSALVVAAAVVTGLTVLAVAVPGLFGNRLVWYTQTLDPRTSDEWSFRWNLGTGAIFAGIRAGGPLGQGTGSESLGQQYLYRGQDADLTNLYVVEGGFGSVAVEMGFVGLVLWVAWVLAWLRRGWRSVVSARGTPLGAAGLVIWMWILYFLVFWFFGGLSAFQDYLANSYFWLLSGVVFALRTLAVRSEAGPPHAAS
jgi:hypothetical protein